MKEQRIVCAANKDKFTGNIIIGLRHWDKFMHEQADAQGWCGDPVEQGFLDNFGKFLTRTEAWVVAKNANQIIYEVGGNQIDGGTLFSENLY